MKVQKLSVGKPFNFLPPPLLLLLLLSYAIYMCYYAIYTCYYATITLILHNIKREMKIF